LSGRLLAVAVLASLVLAAAASANHQEPRKRLTKEDNARARAMLVTRADVPGFRAQPGNAPEPHVECAASVSESDLTLTGEADGKTFESGGIVFIGSVAQVFATQRDADASWRRSTSAAGIACAKTQIRAAYKSQNLTLRSLVKIPFPRVSDRTAAFRAAFSLPTPQGAAPVFQDYIAIAHSRAHATVAVAAALVKPTRSAELRLARLVAGRMKTAMRGA
jgi:hypothetical protein